MIVTLVAHCPAGVVGIVVVVDDANIRHHRHRHCVPLLHRHRRQLCRPSPFARRAITIVVCTLTTNPPMSVPNTHIVQFWLEPYKRPYRNWQSPVPEMGPRA